MSEWQPIETAPKDGTHFLGAYRFEGKWIYVVCFRRHDHWASFPGTWGYKPTHWMLPTPPPIEQEPAG